MKITSLTKLGPLSEQTGEIARTITAVRNSVAMVPITQKLPALFFSPFITLAYVLQKALIMPAHVSKEWQADLTNDYIERLKSLSSGMQVQNRLRTSLPLGAALWLLTQLRVGDVLAFTNANGIYHGILFNGLNYLHFHQILPTCLAAVILLTHLVSRELFIFQDKKWIERITRPIRRIFGSSLEEFKIPLRPVLLWGAYFVAPVALLMMLSHTIKGLLGKPETSALEQNDRNPECLQLRQCVSNEQLSQQSTFFLSPVFSWTMLGIFVSGLPALTAALLYKVLGIDAYLGFPSHEPNFVSRFVFIGLYLAGLGWCISTLFFRAYFTFPLNFLSTEYDVTLDSDSIRKSGFKGWFATLLYFPLMDVFDRKIEWKELVSISCTSGHLRPLPETIFSKDSLIYKFLDKLAALIDAVGDRFGGQEYLLIHGDRKCSPWVTRLISTLNERCVNKAHHSSLTWARPQNAQHNETLAEALTRCSATMQIVPNVRISPYGGNLEISVRLWELSKEEKAKLFYALRKWAPEIPLSAEVQEKLIGSAVMRDARYTDIWFDVLVSNPTRLKERALECDDNLHGGKYIIERKLESGGQAVAYLARTEDGQKVVVKEFVLAAGEGLDALVESAADFENESTILSQLSHPKIVKMNHLFIEDHRVYLVLEHVAGTSLRALVKERGPLSEDKVIMLALDMCDILSYLHGLTPPLVHRDFTPDNLILGNTEALKLIDFGLAQQFKSEKSTDCAGKHSYTPPEQFRKEACPQSDIYALGATLYFLLTGSDPTPITQLHPQDRCSTVSHKLDAIVARATALNLEDRYESITWLKLELEAINNPKLCYSSA